DEQRLAEAVGEEDRGGDSGGGEVADAGQALGDVVDRAEERGLVHPTIVPAGPAGVTPYGDGRSTRRRRGRTPTRGVRHRPRRFRGRRPRRPRRRLPWCTGCIAALRTASGGYSCVRIHRPHDATPSASRTLYAVTS